MRKKMMSLTACLTLGLTLAFGASTFAAQHKESTENSKVVIPATVNEIFSAVDTRVGELEKTIIANDLDKVHVTAFEIRDLLLALPEKPNTLTPEGKTALSSSLNKIKQQAGLLDKFGDSGDLAQTKAVFGKFKAEIGIIKQLPGLKP
ncbi:MAG: hypothetical protein Q7U02_15830 [Desulfosalsimonadaceae bacterium]|nr:hypothetical protein [Desulfosalsimonadaceae bacterium]